MLLLQRYIDWCLDTSYNIDKPLSIPSQRTNISLSGNSGVKRLKSEHSASLIIGNVKQKPEDIIICERQLELYCGRHVLRALSQRLDLFSDEYLIEIAQNLAAAEQICRYDESLRPTQYYYTNSGEYDIQVLKVALLNIFNVELMQIHTIENNTCPIRKLILSNTQYIQAWLIHQDYHYYCLRRFRLTKDYFFKIDSKNPMHHLPVHCQNILQFLNTLIECGSNVYVSIQRTSDAVEDQISINNIEARLWALPHAPADLEILDVL
jgi:hypothetical protein